MESRSKNNMKSDAKAIELRNKGNDFFKRGKLFDALLKYNGSLCFAEDQQQLAYAYGNRSAAYMELKAYKQCLHNIQLAREHNYPVEKMTTLDNREAKCKEEMLNEKLKPERVDPSEFIKLSYPSNPKIPFIIDGLELKKDKNQEKGVYTNRALKIGDVISIDPLFVQMLNLTLPADQNDKFHYCGHCINDNFLDLFPCTGCNSTMFCSVNCKSKAQAVHQHECAMDTSLLSARERLVIRIFFKSLSTLDGSVEKFEKLLNEEPKTVFDFDWSDSNQSELQLKSLFSSQKNVKIEENESLILETLYRIGQLKGLWSKSQEASLKEIIHRLIITIPHTTVGLHGFRRNTLNTNKIKKIGTAFHYFEPLLKRSCNSNVAVIQVDDKLFIFVVQPIPSGSQIYSVFQLFMLRTFEDRLEMFKKLSMNCDCEACKDPVRYVTFPLMNVYDQQFYSYVVEQLGRDFKKMSQQDAYALFCTWKAKLQAYYSPDRYPSQESFIMIGGLVNCFIMCAKNPIDIYLN